MNNEYSDIINLPHHKSENRPHMSLHDRAAQFAPFAALRGYDEEVAETARITEEKIELSDEEIAAINEKLNVVIERIKSTPEVEITYFVHDEVKEGGVYVTVFGSVYRIDDIYKLLYLTNGLIVPIENIHEIVIKTTQND